MKSDAEIDVIVDELLDEATARAWGGDARFKLVLLLGLMDGDVIELDGSGVAQVSASAEEIDGLIAGARAAKAAGKTMAEYFD
jgi:hypothetical protein